MNDRTPPPAGTRVGALVSLLAAALALAACGGEPAYHHPPPPGSADRPGKVPITTRSAEARQLYLQGRELFENLRRAEAHRTFENAAARDPDFALAQLGLAQTAPSSKDRYAALKRAVALAGGISDGERWLILAFDAGVEGRLDEQVDDYRKLGEAYPNDERAQTQIGNYLFGRLQFAEAIPHYRRAIEIAPSFPPPYNQIGYCYRELGRYDQAEEAFKKYIALVPGEPNPYDSYAELLMKVGRFEDSIASYRKALSINDGFASSSLGIARDQALLGRLDDARATLQRLYDRALDDGERRQALAETAAGYLFAGDHPHALDALRRRAALAEGTGDLPGLVEDHALLGDVLLDAGRAEEAIGEYDQALAAVDHAPVSAEAKERWQWSYLYRRASAAIVAGDLRTAATKFAAYQAAVERLDTPWARSNVHELAGRLALAKGDAAGALAELAQADQQDPQVLYVEALAARAAGDVAGARSFARQAADFNGLGFSYALVRRRAQALLAEL